MYLWGIICLQVASKHLCGGYVSVRKKQSNTSAEKLWGWSETETNMWHKNCCYQKWKRRRRRGSSVWWKLVEGVFIFTVSSPGCIRFKWEEKTWYDFYHKFLLLFLLYIVYLCPKSCWGGKHLRKYLPVFCQTKLSMSIIKLQIITAFYFLVIEAIWQCEMHTVTSNEACMGLKIAACVLISCLFVIWVLFLNVEVGLETATVLL